MLKKNVILSWNCLIKWKMLIKLNLLQEAERGISMHNMAAKETQIGEPKSQRKTNTDTHCSEIAALLTPLLKQLFYLPWHNITGQQLPAWWLVRLVSGVVSSRLLSWGSHN